MIDEEVNQETTTFWVDPGATQGELDMMAGKVCWIIDQEGYGHTFRNMYMRSSNPVISEIGRINTDLVFLYIEGSGYVYLDRGEVVVWND